MAGITLDQLTKRLEGELDLLPAASLRDRIKDALRDIYDEMEWGCFFVDSYIRTPAQILGTAAVTEFSTTLVLDSATKVLLNAATDTADKVPAIERQLKVLNTTQTDRAFWYSIAAYDETTGTIILDKPFQDITNAAARIQILKLYYNPPSINIGTEASPNLVIDFKRFEFVVSTIWNRRLLLDITQEVINHYDPTRIRTDDPRAIIPKGIDANGDMLYELYPAPVNERVYRVKYLRTGLVPQRVTDTIPSFFSQELVLARAKIRAYEWIIANQQKLGLRSVTQFPNLIALQNSPNNTGSYISILQRTKKRDEELYPRGFVGDFSEIPSYDFWYGGMFGLGNEGFMQDTVVIDAAYTG